MDFPHGQTVYRDRRASEVDPYNPDGDEIPGDWDPELTATIENAFVASSSSSSLRDATRNQILTAKSLFLGEPEADVLPGDRIRIGASSFENGPDFYFVKVRPAADVNPFTGWQPAVEIPLELTEG